MAGDAITVIDAGKGHGAEAAGEKLKKNLEEMPSWRDNLSNGSIWNVSPNVNTNILGAAASIW